GGDGGGLMPGEGPERPGEEGRRGQDPSRDAGEPPHASSPANPVSGALFSRWRSKASSIRRSISWGDRKSTRLNSSHVKISYAVFCLKKNRSSMPLPACP